MEEPASLWSAVLPHTVSSCQGSVALPPPIPRGPGGAHPLPRSPYHFPAPWPAQTPEVLLLPMAVCHWPPAEPVFICMAAPAKQKDKQPCMGHDTSSNTPGSLSGSAQQQVGAMWWGWWHRGHTGQALT